MIGSKHGAEDGNMTLKRRMVGERCALVEAVGEPAVDGAQAIMRT